MKKCRCLIIEDDMKRLRKTDRGVLAASIPLLIAFAVFIGLSINYMNQNSHVEEVECTIFRKTEQQEIRGSDDGFLTTYTYYVTTDKGTFQVRQSFMWQTFNAEEIYFGLVEGEIYILRVAGKGRTLITPYKNIIGIKEHLKKINNDERN